MPEILPLAQHDERRPVDEDSPSPPDVPLPIPIHIRSVRTGAWILNYKPVNSPFVAYDGTLRVESIANGKRASGDLYQRPTFRLPFPPGGITILGPPPNPANGIPIQPINKYRFYLRVTSILEYFTFGNAFDLGLELYAFTPTNSWSTTPIKCTANMKWGVAPNGYPSDFLEGDLKENVTKAVLGHLKMGWISPYYRKVTVEIDTVAGSERPLDDGHGHDWYTVAKDVGYELTLDQSDQNVVEPSGDSWADNELHAAMLARRDQSNLNVEWRYHALAVKNLDSTPRGIMYDVGSTDSDQIPREGLGISTHWIIPSTGWGTVGGMRFGLAKQAHFRAAVHEWGHALGLQHNFIDFGFMSTSDVIAGQSGGTFPNNIKWAFADNDLKRLRHWPDIFVRPGGVDFGFANEITPPLTPDDQALALEMPELSLEITPLITEVPLGAPVRVALKLTNISNASISVPADISLKSPYVSGVVRDSSKTIRSFKPLIACVDENTMTDLEANKSVSTCVTLLRGREGSLFPSSGVSEIEFTLRWSFLSTDQASPAPEAVVKAKTTVFITGAQGAGHAKTAHRILTTPDAHVVLVLGGDYLDNGVEAVKAAARDEVLGPHWKAVEAKRLAKGGAKEEAKKVLETRGDDVVVMTVDEEEKLGKLLGMKKEKKNGWVKVNGK